MDNFQQAVQVVLKHEGGFVNNPNDPGGATNFGISMRFLRFEGILLDMDSDGDMDVADIKLMTVEKAISFYKERFWDRYGYGRIPDLALATKVFDTCVLAGSKQAHLFLQRALKSCGWALTEDGNYGDVTQRAIVSTPSFPVLAAFRSEAAGFYRLLAATKPTLKEFENGWLARAYS